jgi:hypothetical protein
MRSFLSLLCLVVAVGYAVGCSESTPTNNDKKDTTGTPLDTNALLRDTLETDTTFVTRIYNSSRGGVQIVNIYFDQGSNADLFGIDDEWVVLQANGNVSTKGWELDAGSNDGQHYDLPDSIYGTLTIYTHAVPGGNTREKIGLGVAGNRWIWNNSEPDVARIYDERGSLVDAMSYYPES